MKAPSQSIRIQMFDKGTPPQLIAAVKFNVIFNFEGYTPDDMMALLVGGQPPRVVYQAACRELNKDKFVALDGTTRTVMVKDLYANTGRKGISIQTAYLRLDINQRAEYRQWCEDHKDDPIAPKPVKSVK